MKQRQEIGLDIVAAGSRLEKLLGYLVVDPDNQTLLVDGIECALAANQTSTAADLAGRLAKIRPGSFEASYFLAMVGMAERDFDRAVAMLEPLAVDGAPPNVMFNLAWSKAMVGAKDEALGLLSAAVTKTFPAAAMLRTQLLHEAGDFEGAMAFGKEALAQYPDDTGLNAAMATLALDLEDLELARACAIRGGEHPEAMAATGMLEMQDGDPAKARASFERSLANRQHNPRAWIGRGLTSLVERNPVAATGDLDRGAQQFGDHIGSWIAAGWAHYLAGDIDAAGQRFERAMALDPAFAESHGSLAVIDIARDDLASARRRMTTALRLDRKCFSAALAQAMLQLDNPVAGRKLIEQAFETPLNAQGMTVAGYLAGMARPTIH